MNEVLVATIGGGLALVLWGISDWLVGKSSKKHKNQEVNLAVQLAGALVSVPIFILSGHPLPDAKYALALLLESFFIFVAYISFIRALSVGQAGIVVPLSNAYPLVVLLGSVLFLSAKFTTLQVLAMVIIVSGAILLGMEKIKHGGLKENVSQEVVYSLLAALLWGAGLIILETLVGKLPWETLTMITSVNIAGFALVLFAVKHRKRTVRALKRLPENRVGLISGIALTVGSIAFFVAGEATGSILIAAVIASASPLITSVLAAVFDKERIIAVKRVGAILVVLGVILLNIP